MNTQQLNLARKWRSKNFDQIVGQDLSVRMLKNSLYLNHYFPVYLFAGQRGCGKTSTARVFAAAINCDQLTVFQKDPKNAVLPCLDCSSCVAMMTGRHPDFIEIDAASNTGVDNVRQIIDSSALLPLMGRKKIYLIDEVHMLSKAAFNAFLKIMEEPPVNVIFILATTDTQKIIETVRSRCFQLYFRPVQDDALLNHLVNVCAAENIAADAQALSLIINETGGSVRDALNLLEQVRFSDARVSKDAVYQVLGQLDEQRLLSLFEILLYKSPADFLQFSHEHSLEKFSAEFLWQRITELLRASIWIKNGVPPRHFAEYAAQLQFLTRGKSLKHLSGLLELLYSNEPLFKKTTAQYAFLEVILLRVCQKNESNSNSSTPVMAMPSVSAETQELEAVEEIDNDSEEAPVYEDEQEALWQQLVGKIDILHDPLLSSIFKQGAMRAFDKKLGVITVEFPKELTFFSDLIESSKLQWQPLFEQVVGSIIEIKPLFTKESTPKKNDIGIVAQPIKIETISAQPKPVENYKNRSYGSGQSRFTRTTVPVKALNEPRFDISDSSLWPQAHMLLQYFPGTITQIRD